MERFESSISIQWFSDPEQIIWNFWIQPLLGFGSGIPHRVALRILENSAHIWWHRLVAGLSRTFLTNMILFLISGDNLFQIMPDCLPFTLTSPWPVIQTHPCSAEQPNSWCFLQKRLYLPPPGNSRENSWQLGSRCQRTNLWYSSPLSCEHIRKPSSGRNHLF